MKIEMTLKGLLDLWDQWPRLFGAAWVDVYPRLEQLLLGFRRAANEPERSALLAQIWLLFYPHSAARLALVGAAGAGGEGQTAKRSAVPTESGDLLGLEPGSAVPPPVPALLAEQFDALSRRIDARTETRHTDVTAPQRLPLGQRVVVTVRLTCDAPADSVSKGAIGLEGPTSLTITLRSSAADLAVVDGSVRKVTVEPGRDTEPVVFYIRGESPGPRGLLIEFRQPPDLLVAVMPLTVEVVASARSDEHVQTLGGPVGLGGLYAPPPDLDLRVTARTRGGEVVLGYVLHSPNGVADYHYQPFPDQVLVGADSLRAYQARLLRTVERLIQGEDEGGLRLTPPQVEDQMIGLGRSLFIELFPPALRDAYRRFRDRVSTFQITSDEPWIPWELVRPYDDSDPERVVDDDFLCVRFQLTRWLAGSSGGAGKIRVGRLACVEAVAAVGRDPLLGTPSDRQSLAKLAAAHGVEDLSPGTATRDAVIRLLDGGGIGLWHFATHGEGSPQEPRVVLDDGLLRPRDINGARQTFLARDRPLVFLNTCRGGQLGWSLTGLGGWAAELVGRCRCGSFVGPLWDVNDELAGEFAQAFYVAVGAGRTVGQATREARLHVRRLLPHDPAFLAYSVYAHPNARVELASALAVGPLGRD